MKSILTLAVLAAVIAIPAHAAEDGARITKGTKSYQARNWSKTPQEQTPANSAEQPADPANIEPAAGGDAPAETSVQPKSEGKSFREEMRLPRKN